MTTQNKINNVNGLTGFHALFLKEFSDHLCSKRFLILLLLIGTTAFAGVYGASLGMSESIAKDKYFIFLKLFTTSSNSIPSFMSFIALLGPIFGLALGFDSINNERSSGTLNRLISQPIYRDSVIIGKFASGTSVIALIVYSLGVVTGTLGSIKVGIAPEGEEVFRVLVFLTLTVIYISFWFAVSILFSVICRNSATSALASIAVWLFFSIFMNMIANIVSNAIYPVNNEYQAYYNTFKNYTLKMGLNRISPYYLFSEASSTIMNPSVRSVNVVTMEQLSGAINGYLAFDQSLLLIWPHLAGLAALLLITFGSAYLGFMRQEVRTS